MTASATEQILPSQPALPPVGWFFLRLALLALALFGSNPTRAGAPEDYAAGVKAYRAGQDEEALRLFRGAFDAGMATPTLRFNMALCLYRLRRYAEAQEQFLGLTRDEDFRAAAEYHLGLIAYQQGRSDDALQHLNTAQTLDPILEDRVDLARARITDRPESPTISWYFRAMSGYDSNVEYVPDEDALGFSPQADGFSEVLASIEHRRGAWRLGGAAYQRSYFERDDSNQTGLQLSVARNFIAGRWLLELGGGGLALRLGDERLQEAAGLSFSGLHRSRRAWQPRVSLGVEHVSVPDRFGYLEGWRARLGLTAIGSRLYAGYELEYNDREDEATDSEFFSHSPLRHSVFAGWQPTWFAPVEAELLGYLRYSRFSEDDLFLSDATLSRERREEMLASLGLYLRFPHVLGLRPRLGLLASSNRSSIDTLEYEKLEFTGGFEYY